MLSPHEEKQRVVALLDTAFSDWRDAVVTLRGLANAQLEAIVLDPEGASLQDILSRKSRTYQEADAAARNALALREHAVDEQWADTEGIRDEIEIALDDLARVEEKSRELLNDRVRVAQAELDHVHRGRDAARSYSGGPSGTPRFLDQRR